MSRCSIGIHFWCDIGSKVYTLMCRLYVHTCSLSKCWTCSFAIGFYIVWRGAILIQKCRLNMQIFVKEGLLCHSDRSWHFGIYFMLVVISLFFITFNGEIHVTGKCNIVQGHLTIAFLYKNLAYRIFFYYYFVVLL